MGKSKKNSENKNWWLNYIIERMKSKYKRAKEDGVVKGFKKDASKWLLVFSTIFLPYLKALFYTYQRGRFSVHNISPEYIELGDDIIQECILYLGIVAVIFFSWIMNLAISPRKGNILKNIGYHMVLYIFQYFFLILFISPEVISSLRYIENKEVKVFLTWVLIAVVALNVFPFFTKVYYRFSSEDEKEDVAHISYKHIKFGTIVGILAALGMTLIFFYYWGETDEKSKTNYNCVREKINASSKEEYTGYICNDGYVYYAIVDEQSDTFIMCILKPQSDEKGIETGNYIIDNSRKKIVQNKGIEIFEKECINK